MFIRKNLRRIIPLVLVAPLVALTTACGQSSSGTSANGSSSSGDVIKVGASVSLTGQFSKLGVYYKHGLELWADQVNAKGGIDVGGKKMKVQLVTYDDESKPDVSAKLVQKLISEDGAKFIVGSYGTATTQAASAQAEKMGAIYINAGGVSTSLHQRGLKNFFGAMPLAVDYLKGVIDLALSKPDKPQTIAFLHNNAEFTTEVTQTDRKYAEQKGLKVVFDEGYPSTAKDVSTLIARIKTASPDMLLVGSYQEDAMMIVRQLKEANFAPKMLAFSVGPTTESFVKSLGKDAEYVYSSTVWLPDINIKDPLWGDSNNLVKLYEQKFNGEVPDDHVAMAVGSADFIRQAIEQAKSTDVDKVRQALATGTFDTFFYKGKFGPDGRGTNVRMHVIQIQDGKPVKVWPREDGGVSDRFPMPAWNQR